MSGRVKHKTPQTVVFQQGARHQVVEHMKDLGCSKALVLSTPEQTAMAEDLAASMSGHVAGVYSRAAMHTPVEVTADALDQANALSTDCYVAIGGGSTTGLAKALALRTGAPQIVIPTTYAGSEATPILGQTEDGEKTTLTNPAVLPEVILYDPELVVSLPKEMTVNSGLNAMAHAAEALYAKDRTEQTTAMAIDGLRAFRDALPRVIEDPADLAARAQTQRGAYACGAVLGTVGMALHHKLCHTLGGAFDLPHAQTHAIILPHAIHYNAAAVPEVLSPITELFGGDMPGVSLRAFSDSVGAPKALRDFGLTETDLDQATDMALRNPYWNPRDINAKGIRALLQNAWSGSKPS